MPMGALAGGLTTNADGAFPFLAGETTHSPQAALADALGFGLFILSTAALLLRPADSIPSLANAPIYECLVTACLCLSIPRLMRQLSSQAPARPITQLVFGIFLSVILSHMARGSLWDIRLGGIEFFKIFIYYLLIVSWVDSPSRLQRFMLWLCICTLAQTVIGVLEYDGWLNLSTLRTIDQTVRNPESGTALIVRRLCGIGIFNDPNDLCLLLVTTLSLSFGLIRGGASRRWWFWGLLMGFFTYAIALTRSRTGLLSLMVAIGTFLLARYGRGRALIVLAVLLPLILLAFAGRQTHVDLSDPGDTFQTRLDCWSDSLDLFKTSPVFGVGQGQQRELRSFVAHNSFIQAFAELGFIGGACFLGAFLTAIRAVRQTNLREANPQLARLQPIFLAIVVAYAIGLLALSRDYEVSTYLILGLVAAYINLTPRTRPLRLNSAFLQRLAVASAVFVAATYLFVRIMSK
ncbi:MAG TPA: O-antigen ligase family protein [Tepidisphaeraceae bacterium]|jgi:O-antigen ligase